MTRGDIYMLDFGIPFGNEPGRLRPVVIIQADKENLNNLNTKVVVPLTSNTINADLRGNVFLPKNESGLSKDSVAVKPVVMLTAHWAENGRILRQATFVAYINQQKFNGIVQGEFYEKSNLIISCISSFNNWL